MDNKIIGYAAEDLKPGQLVSVDPSGLFCGVDPAVEGGDHTSMIILDDKIPNNLEEFVSLVEDDAGRKYYGKEKTKLLKYLMDFNLREVGMRDLIGTAIETTYEETKTDLRDVHRVDIQRKENGFLVVVGCKSFVFSTMESLLSAIKLFYTDPKKAQEKYCRKEGK